MESVRKLLEVTNVSKTYRVGAREIRAVSGVSFAVQLGETLAIIGESGAGKSTIGRMVARLVLPDSGAVVIDGTDIVTASRGDVQRLRRTVQMVFQDPFSSIDPRYSMLEAVMEPLKLHGLASRGDISGRALELLDQVGIGRTHALKRSRELSGGQLQRVAIARALAVEPRLIVLDEPVAALDMSIRAQVLNLLADLQQERGISFLFITHDLSSVGTLASDVLVMRDGDEVERGPLDQKITRPESSYTRELLNAVPQVRL